MQTLWQDLRYGVRVLLKHKSYTAVAVIALALGVGANTAVFSVLTAVLVRPLPYREADRLVWLTNVNRSLGVDGAFLNPSDILDYREQAQSIESIASWGTLPINLTGGAGPERVESVYVTTNFFRTLGAAPLMGRDFVPADGAGQDDSHVIISHALWQRQFGGAADVIGRTIRLGNNGPASVVVGVMPADVNFPARVDLWTAYDYDRSSEEAERGGAHYTRTLARLKPRVTVEQAQGEISRLARLQAELYPATNAGWDVTLTPFREHLFGSATVALPLLFGAVCLVLLIACVNVANLQLARADARQKEIAVRAALGAGRGRIVRQLLTESLILAVTGGALGVLLATWAIDLLRAFGGDSVPRLGEASVDARALLFTAGLSIGTGVVFGLAPAWQASKLDQNATLKSAAQSNHATPRAQRFRGALVAAQIALAIVLLAGAGLLLKSFWTLLSTNPGFDADQVLTAGVSLSFTDYPNHDRPRRQAFFQRALQRVAALPGVESVGATSHLPFGGRTMQLPFVVEGDGRNSSQNETVADYRVVTPDFFKTLRVPVKSGRVFTERDVDRSPAVYVVNEAFARTHLANRDPLRERISVSTYLPVGDIVGVVGDMKHRQLENEAQPTIYICYLQHGTFPIMNFVVRTSIEPASLAEDVRRELQSLDPNQVVFNVRPFGQFLSDSTAQRRFHSLLLAAFAAIATAIAAAGTYAVMSYTVARRTRELGVRVALGARARDVFSLILRQGLAIALAGTLVGLFGAFALARLMTSLLYGIGAHDPLTFAAIAAVMVGVALIACYVPARRAAKIDPMIALRHE